MKEKYRVGIISDTHGLLREEVINKLKTCDYIIHGGDINKKEIIDELKKIAPIFVVRGNNDKGEWAEDLPRELYFNIGEINFYMIHNIKEISNSLKNIDVIVDQIKELYPEMDKESIIEFLKNNIPTDKVLVHGDYSLPNILIDNKGNVGIIDLGDVSICTRYFDLYY